MIDGFVAPRQRMVDSSVLTSSRDGRMSSMACGDERPGLTIPAPVTSELSASR